MQLEFCVPASQRLADLFGIADDLQRARTYCDFHIEIDPTVPGLPPGAMSRLEFQRQAFCRAAIISYGRAFNTGVRGGVTAEMLAQLPPHLQDLHNIVKALRDKWVAHAVNHFDDVRVVLTAEPTHDGALEVRGVGVAAQAVGGLVQAWMMGFRELCVALHEVVSLEQHAENERVLRAAQALTAEQLARLPVAGAMGGGRPLRPLQARARFKDRR